MADRDIEQLESDLDEVQRRQQEKVHRTEVVHHEGKLMLPVGMTSREAIKVLRHHDAYLEEIIEVDRTFAAFPWDGALALQAVFKELFGWVPGKSVKTFFGEIKPRLIEIKTGINKTTQVPWGRFSLPNIDDNRVDCGVERRDGLWHFSLSSQVKRKDAQYIRDMYDKVQKEIDKGSIYSGQAITLRFRDDDGDSVGIPEIDFVPTDVAPEQLILSREVQAAVETSLLTPIRRPEDCIANGIPVKRGVLLGGTYGTGKTMAAAVAAHEAVKHGVTYLYITRASEIRDAIPFARQYADPACVVFCEDIDRVMDGRRDQQMDEILNIIDGIDGKSSNIIVVLTTNFLEGINPAMLRPGRLDAVIEVTPPDAEAVERLVRHYGGQAIGENADLRKVGETLAGQIPAVIAEVVKRAKLAELRRLPLGDVVTELSEAALLEAAQTMQRQLGLLDQPQEEHVPTLDEAMGSVVQRNLKAVQ